MLFQPCLIYGIASFFSIPSDKTVIHHTQRRETGLKNIKELLKKPSRESQPWAIWIWNRSISEATLLEQLNWFIDNEFGGIAIRPSRDMQPAYLSEEFFSLFDIVLKTAQKNAIGVRIADDFSLPWSGCFTFECVQSVKMRAQQLKCVENRPVCEHEEVTYSNVTSDKDIILVFRTKNGMIEPASVSELSSSSSNTPKNISWKAPEGEWTLLHFKKEYVTDPANGFIPNVFNPKAASAYIQQVLDVFKAHYSKYMPATFEGFITEVPSTRPGNNSIPWDDDLVVKFRSKSKKNMIKLLPALFCDQFPAAQKNRQQIYSFIFQSMYERFVAPLEAWSKKNRFSQWVLSPETSVYNNSGSLVDGCVPPETDLSTVGYQNIDGVEQNYALLKIMADANTNEYRRETVTVIGRNQNGVGATLQSLKSDVDTLLLSGPSKILIDGCFFNLDQRSYAKTPFNPSWYTPGNKNMRELCVYIARTQEIIKNIHWNRQVAVLAPTSEIMAAFLPEDGSASAVGMEQLEKTVHTLDEFGISYDLVTETLLSNCSVRSNGEFGTADRIRKGNYQALIVPYAPDISRNVLIFIEKLVQKEGSVYFVESAPRGTIEDGVSPTMTSRIDKILADRHKGTGIISFEDLEDSFGNLSPHLSIEVNGKSTSEIYHSMGSGDNYELYLFHNYSDQREQPAVLKLPEGKHFTMVNCEDGTLREITPAEAENGLNQFTFNPYPKATTILIASPTSLVHGQKEQTDSMQCNPFTIPERGYRIVLKDQWDFSTESLNALPLSNWNVRIGLSRETGGFSHFYETHFQVKSLPTTCKFLLNSPVLLQAAAKGNDLPFEVTINGTKLEPLSAEKDEAENADAENVDQEEETAVFDESILDIFGKNSPVYSIAEYLVRGFNRISIRTTGHILDPATVHYPSLLFGDFMLVKGQNGWAIDQLTDCIASDSWVKHGFPYLCGKGTYKQSFEIPNEYTRLVLRFSQVSGPINVFLNDKNLGHFNWQPMEIDITSVSEAKRNELVISVVNSIDTLLRMNGRPSGLVGEVFLDVY